MVIKRVIQHLLVGPLALRRAFPTTLLNELTSAIQNSEKRHLGEIRFVVEHSLPLYEVIRGLTPRERAIQIFSELRVWDTEANSGVLLYVLLADKDLEIVADRGISNKVTPSIWEEICREVEGKFSKRLFREGALHAIAKLSDVLTKHLPATPGVSRNELEDTVVRR